MLCRKLYQSVVEFMSLAYGPFSAEHPQKLFGHCCDCTIVYQYGIIHSCSMKSSTMAGPWTGLLSNLQPIIEHKDWCKDGDSQYMSIATSFPYLESQLVLQLICSQRGVVTVR